jgi:cyanate lyase
MISVLLLATPLQAALVPRCPTALHRRTAVRMLVDVRDSPDYGARLTEVAARSARLLKAKEAAGLSFDELASSLGLTNTYTAQLFLGQAKLTAATATQLKAVLPAVNDEDLEAMLKHFPMRGFDERILQEPNVYRTYEAITHYGEAIKRLINEQCGDGIMSAIDFYCDVGTTTGKQGEKRVVITFNGKFLPHIEQRAGDNTAPSPRD